MVTTLRRLDVVRASRPAMMRNVGKDLEPEVIEGGSISLTTHKQVNHLFPSLLGVVP
jgi:hypothetical protein